MGQAVSKLPPGIVVVTAGSRCWQDGIKSSRTTNVLRRSINLPLSCTTASFSSSYPGRRSGDFGTSEGLPKVVSTASNPGNFLRGEGLVQDERDLAQEQYWKERHNLEEDDTKPATPTTTTNNKQQQSDAKQLLQNRIHELPPDLIQFLKDAGPLRQTLDEEQTSPRVLKDAKEKEQRRMRRPLQRERKTMPLMGDDETFTAVRNTNFARASSATKQQQRPPFGITGVQLYDLLSMQKQQQQDQKKSSKDIGINGDAAVVEAFYQKHFARGSGSDNAATNNTIEHTTSTTTSEPVVQDDLLSWSALEIQSHQQLLRHAMTTIDLPILVQDAEGNYLGIAPHQRPGPEVTNIRYVPPHKVQLVLADWVQQQQDYQIYRAKVMDERKHRNPAQRTRTRTPATNPDDDESIPKKRGET
jgi:hypothetical protein